MSQTFSRGLNYQLIVCRYLSTQFNNTSKAHDVTREQSFCENGELIEGLLFGNDNELLSQLSSN